MDRLMRLNFKDAWDWARHWFSRPTFFVTCERCGTVRAHREHHIPADGQMLCPTCRMVTFHKRIYLDKGDGQPRELGQ
jgi:hypothetical protein